MFGSEVKQTRKKKMLIPQQNCFLRKPINKKEEFNKFDSNLKPTISGGTRNKGRVLLADNVQSQSLDPSDQYNSK